MNLKQISFGVALVFVLGACGNGGGPAVPKAPAAIVPATAGTNNPNYNVTFDSTMASALGINSSGVCAQAIIAPNTNGDSTYMNFFGGACPTSNQVAAGSNGAFSLGLDNPSGDEETYYLFDDQMNYVGQTNWVDSQNAFNIVQLCTGPYAIGAAAVAGNDTCKIVVKSKLWSGIVNQSGTSISF